jgi:ceramide glucosyltransferase
LICPSSSKLALNWRLGGASAFQGLIGDGGGAKLSAILDRKTVDLSSGALSPPAGNASRDQHEPDGDDMRTRRRLGAPAVLCRLVGDRALCSGAGGGAAVSCVGGDLEDTLASCCRQDYPIFEIVFGVQDAADPALAAVRNLKERFPDRDITVVVDTTVHGRNRKVANLINMLPSARYDILVFSDSDLHVASDYLARLIAALEKSNTGLVSTLYVGRPVHHRWAARLGASQINYSFLPGALLARALGRRDCLGSTMALHRRTLERSGGLGALVDHLADDNVLGQRVAALGRAVDIADTVPAATVPEATLNALLQHETRWARTIRALVPVSFGLSAIQYPIFWALLACFLSRAAMPYVVLVGLAWMVRAAAAWGIDRALKPKLAPFGLVSAVPVWLLPFRDTLSIIEIFASYSSDRVVWRGMKMEADDGVAAASSPVSPALAAKRLSEEDVEP